ncbi:PHB depolymerase family esterase [Cellulomonas sp. B6]|uniref:PHB depolymerase family esterase n=1 Tax=Cellulomonas sp. B6 TaxID=1295626 RepID=UPI000A618660|nr:PHB depolymerase family esterase [Cellulomonas sp. B6]
MWRPLHRDRTSDRRRRATALATLTALAAAALATAAPATAAPEPASVGIVSVTPVTEVYASGQKVAAVVVEYADVVDPADVTPAAFVVEDSVYDFRFSPGLEDLDQLAPRTVTRAYTNDSVGRLPAGTSAAGRYVVLELDPQDAGGNTVIRSTCPRLCFEKINTDLRTQVTQVADVHAADGTVLTTADTTPVRVTAPAVDPVVDGYVSDTYDHDGHALPYSYRLPAGYDPSRTYPLVVALHGYGSGYDGENPRVNLAVDAMVTAWGLPAWTGVDEDVIVLAPQNERVGNPLEADAMTALVRSFVADHAVDADRVYAATFSWGSTLAWAAMAQDPTLFDAALIVSGFAVSEEQAAAIAAQPVPVYLTHGTSDPVLPPTFSTTSRDLLRAAYVAAGMDEATAADTVRHVEYADEAFVVPDHHAATMPTYSDPAILQWVLAQRRAPAPSPVLGVTAVTEVGSFGQQVTKVVLEYGAEVDASGLTPADFRVEDSGYNFRFAGIETLPDLVDRAVASVWTTDDPARLLTADRPEVPGRFVVLDLADSSAGGWTVIVSRCPTFLCSVRVNPDQLTQVTQLGDVTGTDGALVAAADPTRAHRLTGGSIDREVDQFVLDTFASSTGDVHYAYRLPDGYDPSRTYPLVIALPGHGMGYDGQNVGVQLASDMLAVAWNQEAWTGTDEGVIVLAPQNERLGKAIEGAQTVELVEAFLAQHAVDTDRVYATSVSYGSQLMWEMFSERPDLFAGGLLTGGFPGDEDEFARIAAGEVPMWITHGTNDHLLPVARARASYEALVAAYEDRGLDAARVAELVRWTEYGDDAFGLPDFHLAAAPTLEDPATLQWLLAQDRDPDAPVDPGTPGGTDGTDGTGGGDGTGTAGGTGAGTSGVAPAVAAAGALARTGPAPVAALLALALGATALGTGLVRRRARAAREG